ncbi:adenine deaminase C-terminal domain-containing protein [Bacillus sp. DTU_2020_1000418_1_SI_GHA_SEK_038]|uniref:adenine deaminase C-terminal domain-containing protein n=1 Tax=Bacillus sp. DTU_2020_1000418_1_SI_GHA_SEK_038 TaxID=3077585 RepID=UPI0028E56C04|nr:adenine deaminase C-terminal domain-containing protein [Bacillus sp. DTU_2020_1000418_1_SI_GHA_SEK_038]WNS75455.1 adenine deaminase C-terminal domain-containing protein [Bacillus sp. DTU_2020_1000418_1_SI_GHA_SEK_038]
MKVDVAIINGQVFNTFTKKFEKKHVSIVGDKFYYMTTEAFDNLEAKNVIDATSQYVIPGFMDIHLHIESSMTSPAIFSGAALSHGVTTVVADAHEIANVFGMEGLESFFSQPSVMDIFYAIPSSVPSTTPELETTGGYIGVEEVKRLLQHPKVIALGEAMNFNGIVNEPDSLIRQILRTVQSERPFLPLEAHIPRVSGLDLAKFLYAGLTADHTHQTLESIYEKITNGIFLEFQRKSITPESIRVIVENSFYEYVAFVTDDVMVDDLLNGHLNALVRLAISSGMPAEHALYCATYTPARRMGFQDRGAIVSGFKADFLLLNDVDSLEIAAVYKDGKLVHERGNEIRYPDEKPHFPAHFYESIQCRALTSEDLRIKVNASEKAIVNVIQIAEVGTFTEHVQREVAVVDGFLDWENSGLALIVVMERYGKTGDIAYGFVEHALVEKGAVATTWAHDHHNVMVMGTCAEDIIAAQKQLVDMQGGYVVTQASKVKAICPLPVGGIISDAPIQELGAQLKEVRQAMIALGYRNSNEIMSFSTLSLPVSPVIKITDKGMMNVRSQMMIPLVEDEGN